MTTDARIYWDTDSDPANPGWVLAYSQGGQDHLTAPLDTRDPADVAGARAEAAEYLGVAVSDVRVED